jgi:hypothetical protein
MHVLGVLLVLTDGLSGNQAAVAYRLYDGPGL